MEGSVLATSGREAFRLSRLLPSPTPSVAAPGPGVSGRAAVRAVLTVRVSCRHQLEAPGHYSHLAAFYEDKKGVLHAGPGRGSGLPPVYWLPSIHRYMYPEMKVGQPKSHAVPGLGLGTVVADCCFHE